jgi:hypothetical protein
VVSTGAQTPGFVWVSAPGDYATFNSNHTPDGTIADIGEGDAMGPGLHSKETSAEKHS